jgi:transcriptional regulator with XRE-family HTH domain
MADKKLTPEQIARNKQALRYVSEWLDYRSMSQRDLADRMQVSEATISKWLRGSQSMSMGQFEQIAAILECKHEDLLFPPAKSRGGRYRKLAESIEDLPDDALDALIVISKQMKPPSA